MKKIFMVIALMAMLMLPFTSFSMTALEDGDLSSVTGQAGVSINLDARVDLTADVVAWGDVDGIANGTYTDNPGWVGLTGLDIKNLRVRADQTLLEGEYFQKHVAAGAEYEAFRTAMSTIATTYGTWVTGGGVPPAALSAGFTANNPLTWTPGDITLLVGAGALSYVDDVVPFQTAYAAAPYSASATALKTEIATSNFTPFAPLTIDVATGDATNAYHGIGTTFVRIGLGSLQVAMDSLDADVKLGPDSATPGTPDLKYTLGSLYLADLSLRIAGDSYVDIFTARGADTQGVSIYADATIKGLSIGTLAWGDADGIDWKFRTFTADTAGTKKLHTNDGSLTTPETGNVGPEAVDNVYVAPGTAGWIGLKDLAIAKITVAGEVGIDVGTNAGVTAVNITLGVAGTPFNAVVSGIDGTVALGPEKTLSVMDDNGTPLDDTDDVATWQELGELYVGALDIDIGGSLALGARSGSQGVTIDLSALTVAINNNLTVSWGDKDGYTGAAAAGYVGLKNLNITGLALSGSVSIDVATVGTNVDTITSTNITDMMYAGYMENNLSPTFVHIGLGAGDPTTAVGALGVTIGSLSADVVFAADKTLTTTAKTMGSLYVDTLNVKVNGWVDIAAH